MFSYLYHTQESHTKWIPYQLNYVTFCAKKFSNSICDWPLNVLNNYVLTIINVNLKRNMDHSLVRMCTNNEQTHVWKSVTCINLLGYQLVNIYQKPYRGHVPRFRYSIYDFQHLVEPGDNPWLPGYTFTVSKCTVSFNRHHRTRIISIRLKIIHEVVAGFKFKTQARAAIFHTHSHSHIQSCFYEELSSRSVL